jgi:peptidoglycan/LPS O-acetylase OafA/YrhL
VRYVPALDGLRAISILLVMAYHLPLAVPVLPGGFIGVDVFFVLSGALITRLLLARGEIALGAFWWRRLRRLYPAMIAMLVTTLIASAFVFPKSVLPTTARDAGFCAVYLGVLPALWGKVRFFGHAWSLSAEEIFYLAWPLVLIAIRRTRARVLFAVLVILASEARRLTLWFVDVAPSQRIWVGLDTHAGAIAIGCIVGIAAHEGWHRRIDRALVWIAPVALGAILILARIADRRTTWYAVWGYPLAAIASAIVVARLFAAPARALSIAPLVWIGRLSYSLYLWHVPIFTFGDELKWPLPVSVAVSIGLAVVSWIAIETRFREGSSQLARGVLQESS